MPYGVSASLYFHVPADDQAAIRAGWIAGGGNADGSGVVAGVTADGGIVSPPPTPTPEPVPSPTPPVSNVGSGSAATSTDANGVPIFYTDGAWYYANGSQAAGPGAPPPAGSTPPPPGATGAGGSGGSADSPDDYDLETYQLFDIQTEGRVDPGTPEVKMPSASWADLRDYLAKDQPFLGVHIRNQGRSLKGVVASDLWSPFT